VRTIEKLRGRLGELCDLAALEMLASWDQLVMMPEQGAPARGRQLGTLARVAHERAIAPEIGAWLEELGERELDPLDADIVRLARRDWQRARRVPPELTAERSQAQVEGQERWRVARERDDFASFAPALRRNVELARAYGACLDEEGAGAYQALVYDYDYGLQVGDIARLFSELSASLSALLADGSGRRRPPEPALPVEVQRRAVESTLGRIGVERKSWRVDVSAHPFTAWMGRRDTRMTTRYEEAGLESLLSALHEYGHALYERQIDPALEGTNLGTGTSMSAHESQSKLWENHVARHPAFARVLAAELRAAGAEVTPEELHGSMVGVEPTLVRVSADPLTYPLHIVLRFELERAMIEGSLAVEDLPGAWQDGMRRLLGLEVPSDALGCMQDIHWSAGSFGYFPSYAIGCLLAAALWEAIERDTGRRAEDLERGEVGPIQAWLGERVHRYGRRLDTVPLAEAATGAGLQVDPFLRYVEPFAA